MNQLNLIFLPVLAAFLAFVVYGGLVLPARDIAESLRRRRSGERPA
ncbi:hypothetical protein [Spirillospora sp. NPDC029432]